MRWEEKNVGKRELNLKWKERLKNKFGEWMWMTRRGNILRARKFSQQRRRRSKKSRRMRFGWRGEWKERGGKGWAMSISAPMYKCPLEFNRKHIYANSLGIFLLLEKWIIVGCFTCPLMDRIWNKSWEAITFFWDILPMLVPLSLFLSFQCNKLNKQEWVGIILQPDWIWKAGGEKRGRQEKRKVKNSLSKNRRRNRTKANPY